MILDGKKISAQMRAQLKEAIGALKGRKPGLAFLLVGNHLPSHTYVKMKQRACNEVGIHSSVFRLPGDISQDALIAHITKLNNQSEIDGILVQLPLPEQIDSDAIIAALDPAKDVDGLHPLNLGKMVLGRDDGFFPCTPEGILTLLQRSQIATAGQHVVIVGRSNLVGKPLAILLAQKKPWGNATVTLAHSASRDLPLITKQADILVAAAGKAHMIDASWVRKGVVVVDVGINTLPDTSDKRGYRIVGDVDYASVAPMARAITPVPGGVGPMTIATLLHHTWISFSRRQQ